MRKYWSKTQDVFHLGLLRSQTLLVTTLKRLKTISFVTENSLYRQNFQRNQYLTIKPTSLPPSHILCNRFQILLGRVMKKNCFPWAIKLRWNMLQQSTHSLTMVEVTGMKKRNNTYTIQSFLNSAIQVCHVQIIKILGWYSFIIQVLINTPR